jgi:hypothetical protein
VQSDQQLDLLGPVAHGALVRHRTCAPAAHRLTDTDQVEHAATGVRVVLAAHLAGRHRQRSPHLAYELLARLVQADEWIARGVRASVDLQDILHAPDEGGIGLRRDRPPFLLPGHQRAFLEHAAHRLVRDLVDALQRDQVVGQQPQTPLCVASGWGAASQVDQLRFLRPVELALVDALRGTRATVG